MQLQSTQQIALGATVIVKTVNHITGKANQNFATVQANNNGYLTVVVQYANGLTTTLRVAPSKVVKVVR